MKKRFIVLTAGLILAGSLPATAQSDRVTAWEVQKACRNTQVPSFPRLRILCGLSLPAVATDTTAWRQWTDFHAQGDSASDTLLRTQIHTLAHDPDPSHQMLLDIRSFLDPATARIVELHYAPREPLGRAGVEQLSASAQNDVIRAIAAESTTQSDSNLVAEAVQTVDPAEVAGEVREMTPARQAEVLQALGNRVRGAPTTSDSAALARYLGEAIRYSAPLLTSPNSPALAEFRSRILEIADLSQLSSEARTRALTNAVASRSPADLLRRADLAPETRSEIARIGLSSRASLTVSQVQHDLPERSDQLARAAASAGTARITGVSDIFPLENQNAVISAVGGYAINRAREQAQTYVVRSFHHAVCREEFQTLLSTSCHVLSTDGLDAFQPGMGLLRNAVRSDVQVLPLNLVSLAFSRNAEPLVKTNLGSQAQSLLQATYLFVRTLRGEDPRLAIARLADSAFVAPLQIRFANAPGAALVAEFGALYLTRVNPTGNALEELNGNLSLRPQLELMLKALAVNQPARDLGFEPARVFAVASWADAEVTKLTTLRDSLAAVQSDSVMRRLRGKYATTVVTFLDQALSRPELASLSRLQEARNAAAAVRGVSTALAQEDYPAALIAIVTALDPYRKSLPDGGVFDTGMRIMGFAAEMATTTDASALSETLTRFAGHTNFVRKRQRGYVTVNAFVGASAGRERSFGSGDRDRTYAGPYLPVGIDVGGAKVFGLGRVGLFLQAVDLGAVASWRFRGDTDTTEAKPQAGFAQVFAPGIFPVFHVRGVPLSLGFGYSFTPGLRGRHDELFPDDDTDDTTSNKTRFDVGRLGAFVAFDVPLFP